MGRSAAAGDVTEWLTWFSEVFTEACRARAALIDESLVRARFWQEHKHLALNERQRKVLNRMLEAGPGGFEGGLTQRKYVGMTGASSATAWRDIDDLRRQGTAGERCGCGSLDVLRPGDSGLGLGGWDRPLKCPLTINTD